MPKHDDDRLASAMAQGQAQFDSIKEMIDELDGFELAARAAGWTPYQDKYGANCFRNESGDTWAGTWESLCESEGLEPDTDGARQRIEEDALSVEVRSGWYSPGARDADTKPAEYTILLCTGGPACRIIGELTEHGEPETARLEVQDWFTPWTQCRPLVAPKNYDSEPILLAYARCFYFGEG